ncbi:hypothetical protein [uncultured Chryseobacterium sp.]|uniref:hypothetical protein n=1 Tax=uncultured Chryseobacterium sp. TaxID=259322 RepID=UPI00261866ED|nr:hypothetical protein [uncultured Chryseobacterium sp.]
MIHDKDYIMRIVKNFSDMLSKLILGKNESDLIELQRTFDTQMNDVFKLNFDKLSEKRTAEILDFVNAKEESHQIAYLELLGNLFYVKGKELENSEMLLKSKTFYEMYLQRSGIFSMPIISRINELK